MQKPIPQSPGPLQDVETRTGVRDAVKKLHGFLLNFCRLDQSYKELLSKELSYLYGEANVNIPALAAGNITSVTVSVPGAQIGYPAEATFSGSLQGLIVTAYVETEGVVRVVLQNSQGAPVTLGPGRIRVWVWPRILSN